MTTNPTPDRYRRRTEEVEAVQWTGRNADTLRAFAGHHFDTIDPEDRIDDGDQDAQVLIEASYWTGISPGYWVLKFEDHLDVDRDENFRAAWEPAAASAVVAVAAPPTGQTALRDRIAAALYAHNHPGWATRYIDLDQDEQDTYLARADAVLTVLPPPADRAAVLREEAARIRAHCPDHLDSNSADGAWISCHCDVADDMERRLADEAQQQPEAQTAPDVVAAIVDALQAKAGELQELAEEQMRPSLEERAQEWLEAAEVARRASAVSAGPPQPEEKRRG